MTVTVFYDYACPYSYRAARWVRQLEAPEVEWRPFSLKEANSPPGTPSVFDDPDLSSTAVHALVLAEAAKEADFGAYHDAVYDAFHAEGRRLDAADVRAAAESAGVDLTEFDRRSAHWRAVAKAHHEHGRDDHGIFGTPTLVYDDGVSVFLKLTEIPAVVDSVRLWDGLRVLALCHPELVEIKFARA